LRNRPCNDFRLPTPDAGPRLDHAPHLRLLVLFVAVVLPVTAIVGRLAYVQTALADRFLADWDRTQETQQPIPARDGRILTADGQVLACDELQFDLAVHYRWLEEPIARPCGRHWRPLPAFRAMSFASAAGAYRRASNESTSTSAGCRSSEMPPSGRTHPLRQASRYGSAGGTRL
jgi:penicillin-binding protein 2